MSQAKNKSINKILRFLDDKLLLFLALFLIIFIPLYPKIPLLDALPGYIVRVRLEDILVALACLVYLVQFARHKVKWQTPVAKWILAYVIIALLSIISGLFIVKTIPLEWLHLGKSLLHWFRYIEYFSLFFIFYASIRSKEDLQWVLGVLTLTVLGVTVYGYGQKYWYWPVFSTMNREFSKGMVLYLTEHARVQSTFAGHYDLAAFLVIVLPIFYVLKQKATIKWQRFILWLVHLFGLWLLVVSASRTSFAAYLLAILAALIMLAAQEKTWRQKIWYFLKKGSAFTVLVTVMMLSFGDDMRDRFLQVLRGYPQAYENYQLAIAFADDSFDWLEDRYQHLANWGKAEPPSNGIAYDNTQETNVITATDQQPVSTRPVDVYVDVPEKVLVATDSGEMVYVEKERTWSENALKYGLSFAIRLDELWPNAIHGFQKNPVLGSAYATLNKKEFYQFTEAESTDNNFLRTLGETGLLGFISFYGILLIIFLQIRHSSSQDPLVQALNLAFIAASIGLLANALYIDVFASSKVAFSYWALAGTVIAINQFSQPQINVKKVKSKKTKTTK